MGTNGEGNATLDSGRGLCFPSPSPNGSCNRLQDAGRAAPASHPATVVTGAGVVGMGTLDPGPWINQGVNGDGKEDPAARACEKATGPISWLSGPVPIFSCNLSIVKYYGITDPRGRSANPVEIDRPGIGSYVERQEDPCAP